MKKRTSKNTAVFYAYLDPTNLKHVQELAKKHKCSKSKAINALIFAHRNNKTPEFVSGYRKTK